MTMLFGSKENAALEVERATTKRGAPLKGKMCLWLKGSMVGDFSEESMLTPSIMFYERFVTKPRIDLTGIISKKTGTAIVDKAFSKYYESGDSDFFGLGYEALDSLLFIPSAPPFARFFGIRFLAGNSDAFFWKGPKREYFQCETERDQFDDEVRSFLAAAAKWT